MPAKTKGTTKATTTKKTAKKKTQKKKGLKKTAVKKAGTKKRGAKKAGAVKQPGVLWSKKEPVIIEPGPPALTVPPVEEPAAQEEAIGTVTHYYSHLGVAIIQINKGRLRSGDSVHIKGHTTDFVQQIESMEYEHRHVEEAFPGQSIGLKVNEHAREHDILFRFK